MEVAGDSYLAQGRWATGTVTTPSGAATLTGTSNDDYHYLVFNALPALPSSTSTPLVCASARMTNPTYVGGAPAGALTGLGVSTAVASLVFDTTGAGVRMTVDTVGGSSTGKLIGTTKVASPTAISVTGALLGGGAGMLISVADAGLGKYMVVAGYKVALANGANYQGVASLLCQ